MNQAFLPFGEAHFITVMLLILMEGDGAVLIQVPAHVQACNHGEWRHFRQVLCACILFALIIWTNKLSFVKSWESQCCTRGIRKLLWIYGYKPSRKLCGIFTHVLDLKLFWKPAFIFGVRLFAFCFLMVLQLQLYIWVLSQFYRFCMQILCATLLSL